MEQYVKDVLVEPEEILVEMFSIPTTTLLPLTTYRFNLHIIVIWQQWVVRSRFNERRHL